MAGTVHTLLGGLVPMLQEHLVLQLRVMEVLRLGFLQWGCTPS